MTQKILRKIIEIDEDKCNGCGNCIISCAEGALALVDGKARLVKEKYCDGLAACIGECPQGALSIVEREAEGFDEEAAIEHVRDLKKQVRETPCACPGSAVRALDERKAVYGCADKTEIRQQPKLSHWPVQLTLVPPGAQFLENADVMLIADCVPFAYPDLHKDFLQDHAVLVACPKLDDAQAHLDKLTAILQKSDIKSITVVRMEVPCCAGLNYIARKAVENAGKSTPLFEIVVGIKGEILERVS